MIPPKDIIEFLFGVKINRKANLIINLCILLFYYCYFSNNKKIDLKKKSF